MEDSSDTEVAIVEERAAALDDSEVDDTADSADGVVELEERAVDDGEVIGGVDVDSDEREVCEEVVVDEAAGVDELLNSSLEDDD